MGERREDMDKLKKQKHDHKLTDWLKFGIFAIIMLAPFFSIGGRMAYTIFNKNAYESYSDVSSETEIQYTEIENITDFEVGKTYAFTNALINTPVSSNQQWFAISCDNVNVITTGWNWINSNVKNFRIYKTVNQPSDTITFYAYDSNNIQLGATNFSKTQANLIFTFTYLGYTQQSDNYNLFSTLFYETNNIISGNTLDNAFDYSISKIADEPVFNWVKNTAIYDGINAMFTGLEYETESNPIAIMCAYWLLNTAVYIVIDIVIWAFTKMTHMFIQE